MAGFEVTERITVAGRRLTAAERRVAQVILERPQLVAFGTVADLAGQAGAGAATVVRLAGKLGFDGFSALQSSIRRDLSHQLRPAVERIRELEGTRTTERHRAAAQCNVQATLDGVDHADLDKAVQLLGDLAHPVLVLAGDAQHGIALPVRPRPRRRCAPASRSSGGPTWPCNARSPPARRDRRCS